MSSNDNFAINHQKTPVIRTKNVQIRREMDTKSYATNGTKVIHMEITGIENATINEFQTLVLKIPDYAATAGTAARPKRCPAGLLSCFKRLKIKLGHENPKEIEITDLYAVFLMLRYVYPSRWYTMWDTMMGYYATATAPDTEYYLPLGAFLPSGFFDRELKASDFPVIKIELELNTNTEQFLTDSGNASVGNVSFSNLELIWRSYESPQVAATIPNVVHFHHYDTTQVVPQDGVKKWKHTVNVEGNVQAVWFFFIDDADRDGVHSTNSHNSMWNTQQLDFKSFEMKHGAEVVHKLESAKDAQWHTNTYLANHPTALDTLADDFTADDKSFCVVWSPSVHPSHQAGKLIDNLKCTWEFNTNIPADHTLYIVKVMEDVAVGNKHTN